MLLILFRRNILQIVNSIVVPVSVYMIDLFSDWAQSYEYKRNKRRNSMYLAVIFSVCEKNT